MPFFGGVLFLYQMTLFVIVWYPFSNPSSILDNIISGNTVLHSSANKSGQVKNQDNLVLCYICLGAQALDTKMSQRYHPSTMPYVHHPHVPDHHIASADGEWACVSSSSQWFHLGIWKIAEIRFWKAISIAESF